MKLLLIGSLLFLLTACGGGDSGDASSPNATPDSIPDDTIISETETETEAPSSNDAIVLTMEELVIPDGFSFNTLETKTLIVDQADYSAERSFISLYSDFDEESLTPHYHSKIATAELSDGAATVSFTVNIGELPIVAEVRGISSQNTTQTLLSFSSHTEYWQD